MQVLSEHGGMPELATDTGQSQSKLLWGSQPDVLHHRCGNLHNPTPPLLPSPLCAGSLQPYILQAACVLATALSSPESWDSSPSWLCRLHEVQLVAADHTDSTQVVPLLAETKFGWGTGLIESHGMCK